MRKIYILLNFPRTLLAYIFIKTNKNIKLIMEDIRRFTYNNRKHKTEYLTFSHIILVDKCFRNILHYRLKNESLYKSFILSILFPLKNDMEISNTCDIKGGFVCYHGHGTIINANSIGGNFSVWQGVTIGRNPKEGSEIDTPTIGNNVSIYTNAVVAGNIKIGNNVKIGAGAIVMKDVPNDSIVIGNPCIIKKVL